METLEEYSSSLSNLRISAIIPFYSGVKWLEEAIQSVLYQTLPVSELIVINDGSPESIDFILELYKDKITYIYKPNGGPASARNIGIEKSSGDYIAFLDSDDIWLPDKLEKQIALMEKQKSIWSVTSYETFLNQSGFSSTKSTIRVKDFQGEIYPKILSSNLLATPCIVVNGKVLRDNISFRFRTDMRYGQDQYLWIILALNFPILSIDEVLSKVRLRGKNASKRAVVQLQTRTTIWNMILSDKVLFQYKRIPFLTKLSYRIVAIDNNIIRIFTKLFHKSAYVEFLSKALYLFPWILFKISSKISR